MKDSVVHAKPPKKDDISFDYWLKYIYALLILWKDIGYVSIMAILADVIDEQ